MESEQKLQISLFLHVRDNRPKPRAYTWPELCASMGPHQTQFQEKLHAPLFSPAEFLPGKPREGRWVQRVHLLVLDVDGPDHEGVDESVALEAVDFLQQIGVGAIFYTTWTHSPPDACKFRLVIPLSRPVSREAWPQFWRAANEIFGNIGDKKCADPNHVYFGAFVHPDNVEQAVYHVVEGVPLDVDLLLTGDASQQPSGADNTRQISRAELAELARNLKRRKSTHSNLMGAVLLKVCDGEIYADPGERDDTTFKLTGLIAKHMHGASASSIAEHFAPSLQLMAKQAPGGLTVGDVEAKILRHQEKLAAEKNERIADEQQDLKSRIREAFNYDRDTPYTEDEVKGVHGRWILQFNSSYYIWVDGNYGRPYAEREVLNAAFRDLAPAHSVGVALHKLAKNGGIEPKSSIELVREYGTVINDVEISLTAQKSWYRADTRTLIEAPCPVRNITPAFYADIDQWLRLLCGNEKIYYKLLCWLAGLTLLDRICVALLITGPKGVGKSLIGLGVSRIWSLGGPTSMEEVFAAFNDAILRCPLTMADEHLPRDFRGHIKSQELRWHTQATSRPLLRKFLPSSRLMGATRTLITGNSEDVMETGEQVSYNEMKASLERFLHVRAIESIIPGEPAPAAKFLLETDTSGWVERDMIAQHALWLRDNHDWKPEGRFMIDVDDVMLQRSMINRNQKASQLLQWLVGYLKNPMPYHQGGKEPWFVRISEGKLFVNIKGVVDNWSLYVEHERCPLPGVLMRTMSTISHRRAQLKVPYVGYVNYREVDVDQLRAWTDYSGWATQEEIDATLETDTEELMKPSLK